MVTTAKDAEAFSLSIKSALTHLIDIDTFYVVTPDSEVLSKTMGGLGARVQFVPENKFNFTGDLVVDTMYQAVKEKGLYPLDNGKSPFERVLYSKIGWFLQQLLKLHAGKVLDLADFVLLDSDVVWYRDVKFIAKDFADNNGSNGDAAAAPSLRTYYYATSTQYHPSYISSMKNIVDVTPLQNEHQPGKFRSGVVHHLPVSKHVLDALFATAMRRFPGKEMWKILLEQSALEMTCRAPKGAVCGAGSTLSEYEM
jgi:hypothetical protein